MSQELIKINILVQQVKSLLFQIENEAIKLGNDKKTDDEIYFRTNKSWNKEEVEALMRGEKVAGRTPAAQITKLNELTAPKRG